MSKAFKGKVIVAMSGGVDSSVAAALLKKKGYEVIGVTMQIWPSNQAAEEAERFGGCCSLAAVEDARKVAFKLGIPHYVLNFREVFAQKVINNFCEEYRKGRTPNPCIRCNQYIKFDALLKKAQGLGADFVATGHYIRIKYDEGRGEYLLLKGQDSRKDQSYVLYGMTQEQLKHTLMPLGERTKAETRRIASDLDLPVAWKEESQEICFISNGHYGTFLQEYMPESEAAKPGNILNKKGEVIGRHQGIIFYTVGQRKGLNISHPEPLYVLSVDGDSNTLIVGTEEETYGEELVASDLNFILPEFLGKSLEVMAKIRYGAKEIPAKVLPLNDGRVKVKFEEPQRGIAPGQAVVFYQGETVIGGGTIEQ